MKAEASDFAKRTGVTAVVQPGGSMRDAEAIQACDEHRMAMLFAVAGLVATGPVHVRGMDSVGDSFPGFLTALEALR